MVEEEALAWPLLGERGGDCAEAWEEESARELVVSTCREGWEEDLGLDMVLLALRVRGSNGFGPCFEVDEVGLAAEVEADGTRFEAGLPEAERSLESARERAAEGSLDREAVRRETRAGDSSSLLESSLEAAEGRPRSLVDLSFLTLTSLVATLTFLGLRAGSTSTFLSLERFSLPTTSSTSLPWSSSSKS